MDPGRAAEQCCARETARLTRRDLGVWRLRRSETWSPGNVTEASAVRPACARGGPAAVEPRSGRTGAFADSRALLGNRRRRPVGSVQGARPGGSGQPRQVRLEAGSSARPPPQMGCHPGLPPQTPARAQVVGDELFIPDLLEISKRGAGGWGGNPGCIRRPAAASSGCTGGTRPPGWCRGTPCLDCHTPDRRG